MQFSASGRGTHSEGTVVEFFPETDRSWVGNFQGGIGDCEEVIEQGDRVLVIAGGQGYAVDPVSRIQLDLFGGQVTDVIAVSDGIVIANGLWLEKVCGGLVVWQSRRVSWDGIRNLTSDRGRISGEGWNYLDTWHPFTVDLLDGSTTGGAYSGPGLERPRSGIAMRIRGWVRKLLD